MKVFHLGRTKYAGDLSGKGAELFGGRWNREGIPCIYTSASLSLAVLEYSVNNSLDNIPRALSYTVYEIPDKGFVQIPVSALPGDWADRPASLSAMEFGSTMLKKKKHLIMAFPSVIVPGEFNFLINPLHRDMKKIGIREIRDFVFDTRLKL